MSRKCLGSVRGSSSRRRLGVQERSRRGAGKGERLSSSLRAPAERMFVSCFWRQTLTLRSPARWWMPTIWFSYTWSRDAGRFGEMRGDLVLKHLVARRSEERTPLLRILQAVPRRRPLFVREQVAAIAPRECPEGEVREVSRKCPECQLPRSRLSKSPAHGLYPAKVVVMTASPRVAYSLAISGPLGSSRGRAWRQPARRRHELGLDARHGARRDLISSSQPLLIGT